MLKRIKKVRTHPYYDVDNSKNLIRYAIVNGIIDLLIEEHEKGNQAFRLRNGETLLHLAAVYSLNPEIVEYLSANLERGRMEKRMLWRNSTPLHFAAEYNESVSVVAEFINQGADIFTLNKFNETPLHCAAYNKNERVYDYLMADFMNKTRSINNNGR